MLTLNLTNEYKIFWSSEDIIGGGPKEESKSRLFQVTVDRDLYGAMKERKCV